MDVVPDGEVCFGFPNISDNAEIVEMIASGCHCILFTTGRGSVVGSAISPVIKICANPETYAKLSGVNRRWDWPALQATGFDLGSGNGVSG